MEQPPVFRMKLLNAPESNHLVDLASLATTAKAWHALLQALAQTGGDVTIKWVVTEVAVSSIDIKTAPEVTKSIESDAPPLGQEFWDHLGQYMNEGMARVEEGALPEDVFEEDVVPSVYELISAFHRDGIDKIELQAGLSLVVLTSEGAGRHARRQIRERSLGSVVGTISSVSFNRRRPYFSLRTNEGSLIQCSFDDRRLLDEVKTQLLGRTIVFGFLERDGNGDLIRIPEVWEITSLPREERLPTMDQLYGMVPDLGNSSSATEWVRLVRGED